MLSSDLRIVENYLAALAEGKFVLDQRNAGNLHLILQDCRQRAQAMEKHSHIAQVLTPADLAGNVRLFPIEKRPMPERHTGADPGRDGAA